jgi:outer membrane protein assembly factor BamD
VANYSLNFFAIKKTRNIFEFNMNKIINILLIVLIFSSCSDYQKALKSEDVAVKFVMAKQKYDEGKYMKAIRLFEQMATVYRGKPQAESMFYMYSQSLYKTKQYYLAAYQFESFVALYPKSEKVEESAFLSVKCYFKLSPSYTLDQVDTDKALTKAQSFINTYPKSSYFPECNEIVQNLTEKIEKKAYENAKQYNTISDHKAAIKALDNFISDYPGTKFKEKALFYKLDSSYQLAINSVYSKMEQRLNFAKETHALLVKFNKDTEYKKAADIMLARIDKDLQQFQK